MRNSKLSVQLCIQIRIANTKVHIVSYVYIAMPIHIYSYESRSKVAFMRESFPTINLISSQQNIHNYVFKLRYFGG